MQTFYGHGKLLLTGEYLVMNGAAALAIPTRQGQLMKVNKLSRGYGVILWKSLDVNGDVWFEMKWSMEGDNLLYSSDELLSSRLRVILETALEMAEEKPVQKTDWEVTSQLEFERDWGLGSSSTLIYNVASWLGVSPMQLFFEVSEGSGYDVMAAGAEGPFIYKLENEKPGMELVEIKWPFRDKVFFVHLNQKQSSPKEVQRYIDRREPDSEAIKDISALTSAILNEADLETFSYQLMNHEKIIGQLLGKQTIKEQLFDDFSGPVKSLGAWGGDFVMATGDEEEKEYFRRKGFSTILSFDEMIWKP